MIQPTSGSILHLQCSDAIAVALGFEPAPVAGTRVDRSVMADVKAGNVIAVLTWSGVALIWPVASEIALGGCR